MKLFLAAALTTCALAEYHEGYMGGEIPDLSVARFEREIKRANMGMMDEEYVDPDMIDEEYIEAKNKAMEEMKANGTWTEGQDLVLLSWQKKALWKPQEGRSRLKASHKWAQYTEWNDDFGDIVYTVPIKVKIRSYPRNRWAKLWESLVWSKNHYRQMKTKINVVFVDDYDTTVGRYRQHGLKGGYIHAYNGPGCFSPLGTHYTEQTMSIGWCYKVPGSIVHEIMHALGWVHEHMRPDRDQFLSVGSRSQNCRAMNGDDLDDGGTQYDLGSIMHYSKGGNCRIRFRSDCRVCSKYRVGQRKSLTKTDVYEINHAYN